MEDKKFVLIPNSGYSTDHDSLLSSLLDDGYELFCAVGKDCELWEEAMDEMAVGDGSNSRYITTTSHPGESVEEVVTFAESWPTKKPSGVKVVTI